MMPCEGLSPAATVDRRGKVKLIPVAPGVAVGYLDLEIVGRRAGLERGLRQLRRAHVDGLIGALRHPVDREVPAGAIRSRTPEVILGHGVAIGIARREQRGGGKAGILRDAVVCRRHHRGMVDRRGQSVGSG
jgi:hypothetical protein